jgi:hypothetical protein
VLVIGLAHGPGAAPSCSSGADDEDGEKHMILVTGSTGNVGGEVTQALAAAGMPVRALTRTAAAARRSGAG